MIEKLAFFNKQYKGFIMFLIWKLIFYWLLWFLMLKLFVHSLRLWSWIRQQHSALSRRKKLEKVTKIISLNCSNCNTQINFKSVFFLLFSPACFLLLVYILIFFNDILAIIILAFWETGNHNEAGWRNNISVFPAIKLSTELKH